MKSSEFTLAGTINVGCGINDTKIERGFKPNLSCVHWWSMQSDKNVWFPQYFPTLTLHICITGNDRKW